MLIGPAIAGLVIAGWGLPVCYLLDAATFGVALYGVASLPAMPPAGAVGIGHGRTRRDQGHRAGWRYIARRPALGGSFLTDLAATVLAMPVALFPVINQERFGGHPETLGLFLSAIAVGGIGAGLLSGAVTRAGPARRDPARRGRRVGSGAGRVGDHRDACGRHWPAW